MKQTLFDFNFGYITSALLSICFVTMGAYIMFGTNCAIPNSSAAFAHNVVEMYTASMGDWSYFIIATAAFSIMFGPAPISPSCARLRAAALGPEWLQGEARPGERSAQCLNGAAQNLET